MKNQPTTRNVAVTLFLVSVIFVAGIYVGISRYVPETSMITERPNTSPLDPTPVDLSHIKAVFRAICLWEGRGRINDAYNEKEDAIGPAQIRPAYLQDANEWLARNGLRTFRHAEMNDYEASYAVWAAYMARYSAYTPEQKARIHNGGPRGMTKAATRTYWAGVQTYLKGD